MKSFGRRARAQLYYLRKPTRQFFPLLAGLLVLLALGSVAFHRLHEPPLEFREALFVTYCLVFMEHVHEFPDHWLLQMFYFILPPLGLVVILDGIVTFSYRVMRRDEKSEEWSLAMISTLKDHVILVGLGNVGLRVLEQLLSLGQEVCVLEKNAQCPNLAYARNHGVPCLIGTGREEGILGKLGAERAKSIILATNNDLANLEIALDARNANPSIRVVLRMFDKELATKVRDSFDLGLAFSTSELSAPTFATSSSDRSIVSSFYVGERLLVVAKLFINPESELIDKTIGDYGKRHSVFFLQHSRGAETTFYPESGTVFQAGDRVVVQTSPERLAQLHEWNRDPKPY